MLKEVVLQASLFSVVISVGTQAQAGDHLPGRSLAVLAGLVRGPTACRVALLPDWSRPLAARWVLGRALGAGERRAVRLAHAVGSGEPGANPSLLAGVLPSGQTNYSLGHIRRKVGILRAAGFNRHEVRRLMDSGVAGKPGKKDEVDQLANSQCPDVSSGARRLLHFISLGLIKIEDVDPAVLDAVKDQVEGARRVGGMAGFQRGERIAPEGSRSSFFKKKKKR